MEYSWRLFHFQHSCKLKTIDRKENTIHHYFIWLLIRICNPTCVGGKAFAANLMQPECAMRCFRSRKDWERWEQKLKGIQDLHILRCIKPRIFGKIVETSLHHFLDASEKGYSQCSYIQLLNIEGEIQCSFLIGKSRITPKKFLLITKLELTAAVLPVKMACLFWKN